MRSVVTNRVAGLGLAALMTLTGAGGVALWAAGGPGDDLAPIGGAEQFVMLTQSQESVLWTSAGAAISMIRTLGWPSSDGVHELGGALVLERPTNQLAGTINIGEKPASIEFTISG